MCVYVYASLCNFVCIALLLLFVLGLFLTVFFLFFLLLFNIFIFTNFLFLFEYLYFLSFFLSFFLHFLLSHVADGVLVLRPGVRPVPLRWEIRVQDIDPPETSGLHVISNGKSSPRDLHLNANTQLHSMTSKLQCRTPYAKQLTRQEHTYTHQQRDCLKS